LEGVETHGKGTKQSFSQPLCRKADAGWQERW
jgi:hypothetical protein